MSNNDDARMIIGGPNAGWIEYRDDAGRVGYAPSDMIQFQGGAFTGEPRPPVSVVINGNIWFRDDDWTPPLRECMEEGGSDE